jgi:hypothetical protein
VLDEALTNISEGLAASPSHRSRVPKSMTRTFLSAFLALAAGTVASTGDAASVERDQQFFHSVEGEWSGPGEVVAGKYKGTKFVCNFTGTAAAEAAGMTLDGGCRVGVFMQKMKATVVKNGSGYSGTFNDGAAGKGLDVVSGNVMSARKVVFGLNRKQLKGAMLARLPDDNSMVITVSVRVQEEMVPVIGVSLKRVDSGPAPAVAQE